MRIELTPILERVEDLIEAIRAKSASRASSCAHKALLSFPDPTWAETAPGMRIYYGDEAEVDARLNVLRYSVMKWLGWLTDPDSDCEPNHTWPEPALLTQGLLTMRIYEPRKAS